MEMAWVPDWNVHPVGVDSEYWLTRRLHKLIGESLEVRRMLYTTPPNVLSRIGFKSLQTFLRMKAALKLRSDDLPLFPRRLRMRPFEYLGFMFDKLTSIDRVCECPEIFLRIVEHGISSQMKKPDSTSGFSILIGDSPGGDSDFTACKRNNSSKKF